MTAKNTTTESFTIDGERIVETIRNAIKEGNVRKITITNKEEKVIAEFPLTVGVIGALIAPILAAIGAIAALVAECTITIEKEE